MSDLGPKIPGWLDQIQFLKFWIMNPCEVPFSAYMEAARPIAGEIALALLTLDLRDFVKEIFKPKNLRSGRHTRRGRRNGKKGAGIPELSEMLADTLDPDHRLRPERWSLGPRLFLEWAEVTDRVFYTIFLIEMADTLIINSIVGALEANPKICPNIARAHRSDSFRTEGGAGDQHNPTGFRDIEYFVGMSPTTQFDMRFPEGTFVVVYTVLVQGDGPNETAEFYVHVEDADGIRDVDSTTRSTPESGWAEFVITARGRGPGQFILFHRFNGGFRYLSRCRAFVMQIGD